MLGAALRDSSWYLVEKLVRLGTTFVVGAWVARHLGPNEYGILAFGLALAGMMAFFVTLGLESVVVRDLVQMPDAESEILQRYLAIRLTGALIGIPCILGYVMLAAPENHLLLEVATVLCFATAITSVEVIDCALQARRQARQSSSIRAIGLIAGTISKVMFILANADLVWFAAANLIESVICAVLFIKSAATLEIKVKRNEVHATALTYVHEARYLVLGGAAVTVYSRVDVIAVGSILPLTQVANYAVAAAILAAWNMLGMSLSQAFAPSIATAYRTGHVVYAHAMRRFLLISLIAAICGSSIASCSAKWLIPAVFGKDYVEAAGVLSILIWGSVPGFLGVATSQIILQEKLYGVSLFRTATGMVCTLAFVVPVASLYGIHGVAALTVVCSCIATLSGLMSRRARYAFTRIIAA